MTKKTFRQTWVPTTEDDLYLCEMEQACRQASDPWTATIRRQDSLMFNGFMGNLNAGHRAAAAPASSTGLPPRVAPPRGSPKASAEPRQVPAEVLPEDINDDIPPQGDEIPPPPDRALSEQERVRYSKMLAVFGEDIVLQDIRAEEARTARAAREEPSASSSAEPNAIRGAGLGFDLQDDERQNAAFDPELHLSPRHQT